jgi:phage pi2 protein 07
MQEDREQVEKILQKQKSNKALDVQVGGNHYKDCKIQPVEYIYSNKLDFLEGNVVKYITRHRTKGDGEADIRKVIHYAQMILQMEYNKGE